MSRHDLLVHTYEAKLPSCVSSCPPLLYYDRADLNPRLILILILADLFKATWFLVFAAFALNHNIENGSAFCLAGGFFIQTGLESCGMSITPLQRINI